MKQKEMALATKRQLAAALKKLMAAKPINKITVRELASACGVNRNCFYIILRIFTRCSNG